MYNRLAPKLWHKHRPHCLLKTGSNKTITTVKRNLNDKLQVSNGEIHFTSECVNLVTHTNFTAITGWAVALTCYISHRKIADFDPSGSQNP